jgi:hypothetical protein
MCGQSSSERIRVDHRLRKVLRRFLRRIVTDTAGEQPMLIPA